MSKTYVGYSQVAYSTGKSFPSSDLVRSLFRGQTVIELPWMDPAKAILGGSDMSKKEMAYHYKYIILH